MASIPPSSNPLITPAAKALITGLVADGNDRERRMWELERLWELGNSVGLMRGEVAEVKGEMISLEGKVVRLDLRVTKVESRQDKSAEYTGQHDIAELHRQLVDRDAAIAERKERARHWGRWVVALLGTLAVGIVTGCLLHLL
jgi:hypothetical protein